VKSRGRLRRGVGVRDWPAIPGNRWGRHAKRTPKREKGGGCQGRVGAGAGEGGGSEGRAGEGFSHA
jgi:hypothetical protein